MKNVIIVLFACVALVLGSDTRLKDSFLHFQKTYKRTYPNQEEFNKRFGIFKDNMAEAERLQALNPFAKFGVTKFSDLSREEFKAKYLNNADFSNYITPPPVDWTKQHQKYKPPYINPIYWDWAEVGVITPVKEQGLCGSPWVFSAVETIESQWALCENPLTLLSLEQLLDCNTDGDQGCKGGFPSGAYQYVQSAGGLESEAAYPYTAGESGEGGTCGFNVSRAVAKVTGFSSLDGESGLYTQLSTNGPASACVDASSWQSYQGGTLTNCGNDVQHCVQVTGYFEYRSARAHWNVRNSWGPDWGENGYIWLAVGNNTCSIGDYVTIVSSC